jgi:hypothetical protein
MTSPVLYVHVKRLNLPSDMTFCRHKNNRQETTLVECYVVVSTNEETTSKMNDDENDDNNGFLTHFSDEKKVNSILLANRIIVHVVSPSTNQLFDYVKR